MSGQTLINASGRPGSHGHGGHNGHGGGGHAGDGGDGMPGEPGADINLTLRAVNQLISFSSLQQSGQADAAGFGAIKLQSHGGAGGSGGAGGNGATGATGYRGQDATKNRRGTDGGPGGRGGDAGAGGNGARGGKGGDIIVHCANEDAFTLMVVDNLDEPVGWAIGGKGGAAGSSGSAGGGGAGGQGGSSFHWQTEHWDKREVHHSAQYDSDGKKTQAAYTETVYDKRIEHHSTPGGNQGPRGPSGSGANDGHRGSDAPNGRVSIKMGGWSYERRYALSVASYYVKAMGSPQTPALADAGIYEFGEVCHVQNIKLLNKGGSGRAPSPAHQRVRVRLQSNRWVTKVGQDVFCAQSVWAGTTSSALDGVVPFEIAYDRKSDFRPAGTTLEFASRDLGPIASFGFDPIVEAVEVRTIPSQLGVEDATGSGSSTRFQREYANGHRTSSITAQFPVKNTDGLNGLKSLSNAEASTITLALENISERDLGRANRRPLKVVLWGNQPSLDVTRSDNYILPHQLRFTSYHDDCEHSLAYPGYAADFPTVPKRRTTPFRGVFTLDEALSYAGGELRCGVFLSDLHTPSGWRLVQQRALKFRCEPNFTPDLAEGPIKLLLVCSTAISRPKYAAWHAAAASLGLRVETYPITRYGHLNPCVPLPFGDKPELGHFMRDGCLVLCLDDEFESVKRTLRMADVVAPWHLRAPGGGGSGEPCNYLFVRGESHGHAQQARLPEGEKQGTLGRWNTALQTRLLHRMAAAPPRGTRASAVADEEELVAMATDIVVPEQPQEMVLQGAETRDPFKTYATMPVLLRPKWNCDSTGLRTTERVTNAKLRKAAEGLKKRLLQIPHLDATVVAIPAAGTDWDEMEWSASCCGVRSSRVRLSPAPNHAGAFLVGHLHVYMRNKTAPTQLGMLSLSPKVDPEGDDCAYTVSPLARFGVVQSLPLASRMAALQRATGAATPTLKDKAEALRRHLGLAAGTTIIDVFEHARARCASSFEEVEAGGGLGAQLDACMRELGVVCEGQALMQAVGDERHRQELVRLIVLSLLGDCAIELVGAIDRPGPAKALVVDAVETPTWHALVACAQEAYAGPLICLKGTKHAKELVSGLLAMPKTPGLSPVLRPYHRRSVLCEAFSKMARQIAKALEVVADAQLVVGYVRELGAIKAEVSRLSRSRIGGSEATTQETLSFVVSGLDSRAAGVPPARRQAQLGAALRGCRSRTALLWRFSSAGVAAHDNLEGGAAKDGDDVVLVRGSAALANVDIVSGSEFAKLSRQAHLKADRAQKWQTDLERYRAETQVGISADVSPNRAATRPQGLTGGVKFAAAANPQAAVPRTPQQAAKAVPMGLPVPVGGAAAASSSSVRVDPAATALPVARPPPPGLPPFPVAQAQQPPAAPAGAAASVSVPLSGLAVLSRSELAAATKQFATERLIGEGGFGAVYVADKLPSLGPLSGACAVKLLSAESMQGVKEFTNEVQLLGALRHQNLMPLLGCCEETEPVPAYALVFPLMRGGDFADRLANRKPSAALVGKGLISALAGLLSPGSGAPPPREWQLRTRIVRDAMRGLDYLHKNQWLHRDIKPQNILLDEHAHARLADVGLAKQAISPEAAYAGRTHVSSMVQVGTPGYIDPLISNLGQYSEETDGYAMGMTLTVALVNKPQLADNLEALDELLEDPTCAPRYADANAGWPEAVSLKLAGLIKGLMGARQRRNRMSHRAALADLEKLADEHELRPGIAAAPDVKECVVCMVNPRATRFGCGHALCCAHCADELVKRGDVCPTCRCTITIADRGGHIGVEQTFAA